MNYSIREVGLGDDLVELALVLNELSPAEINGHKLSLAMDSRRLRSIYTFVAVLPSGRFIGTASLVTERKLLAPNCKLVGRVEDVVVKCEYRGKGIGAALVKHCIEVGEEIGCKKLLLQAAENNVEFYKKLGFRQHEVNLRMDL